MADLRDAHRRPGPQPAGLVGGAQTDTERTGPAPTVIPPDVPPPARVSIPTDRKGVWQARAVAVDRYGVPAGCYQRFAWKVRRELEARGATSLAITSSVRDEGKTVTACNLALALASFGSGRIALVDLDLRAPSVARALGIEVGTGLERCFSRSPAVWEARVATQLASLDLFPAGEALPEAHETLGSPALREAVRELQRAYDVLVIDSPPVLPLPDAPLILLEADTCVCVVRAGHTHTAELRQTLEVLPPEKLLGLFLNSARSVQHSERYRHYLEGAGPR